MRALRAIGITSGSTSGMMISALTARGESANRIGARIHACRKGCKINAPLGAGFEYSDFHHGLLSQISLWFGRA
jgi:hypothetical protein